jgi:hypothetical protein
MTAANATKGSFITPDVTKGSFITPNVTKGSFSACRAGGGVL